MEHRFRKDNSVFKSHPGGESTVSEFFVNLWDFKVREKGSLASFGFHSSDILKKPFTHAPSWMSVSRIKSCTKTLKEQECH